MKFQRRNNKNNRRHLSIKSLALMALFLFSVVAPIAGTLGAKARAAADAIGSDYGIAFKDGKPVITRDSYSLEWIDAGQLQITFEKASPKVKKMFVPKNKSGGKSTLVDQRSDTGYVAEYEISGWGGGNCNATAKTTATQPNDSMEITRMEIDIDFRSGPLTDCVDGGNNNQTIVTKNPGLSIAWWQWVDAGKIENINGSRYTGTFENTDPKFPKIFVRTSNPESTCNDRLWVNVDKNEVRFYELDKDNDQVAPKDIQAPNCKFTSAADNPPTSGPYNGFGREIAGKANYSKLSGTGVGNSGGSTVDPGDALKCEIRLTNPLTWFFCPMIDTARELVNSLNGVINDLMKLPTDKLFVVSDTNTDKPANLFYDSWSGFRYIAMGLLVIIALIMVLSQAIGVGPFDAYTIRKVLPRLLAAVVLVSLSWPLMKLAVDITNGLGHSVSGLIYGPFKDGLTTTSTSSPVMGAVLVGAIATGFVFGLVGLLAFMATAALSMLSGVATLIFREMLIMFLVVVAPVAIICSILPNTQIVWKKWSDYFLRALIVFPIFSGVIAIGQVFAVIGQQLHGDSLGPIIAFVGYFGPYFMLPKIFAMSGGAVAAVGSVAQKATAGMRGGLSNYRNKKAGKRVTNAGVRAKDGKFLPGRFDRFGGNAINRRVSGVAGGSKAGFGFGDRGRAYETGSSNRVAAEAKKAPGFENNKYEAGALRALTDHRNEREARAAGVSDADIQTAKTMGGWNTGTRQAALEQRFANKDGFANASEAMATINAMSGGNARRRTGLMANGSFINKSVGRSDMGKLSLQGGDNGEFAGETAAEYQDRMTLEGAATADSATLARNHSIGASNIAAATNRQLVTPANSALHEAAGLVATKMTEAQGYATLGNIGTIQDVSDVVSNTPAALTEVVGRHINPATGEVVVDRTGVTQPTTEDTTRDTRQQELDVAGENLRRATAEVTAARAAAAAVGPAVAGSPPPPELEAAANAEQRLQQRQQEHTAAAATNTAAAAAAVAADTPGATRRTPSVFAKNRSPNPNNPNDPNNPT